jgi:hypothetical protein
MKKVETEIRLKDQVIKGQLVMATGVWSFRTEDPAFVALFPTKSVSSFSTETELSEPARAEVHRAISEKADMLLAA